MNAMSSKVTAIFLKRTFFKYFGSFTEVFQKFNDTSITFIDSLFDQMVKKTANLFLFNSPDRLFIAIINY